MSDVEWNHGEGSEDIGRINDMEEKDKQGKLKVMSISKSAERGFCGACGSTLTMRCVVFFSFRLLVFLGKDGCLVSVVGILLRLIVFI